MSQNEPSVLEANIVKTVAWFSLFEYPLTVFEIWKWLGVKSSLAEVELILQNSSWLRSRLEFKDGFYTLGGRSVDTIIATHQERFLDAVRKFKKLNLAVKYFSLFPFVRAVFACNTLAWHNTTPSSDIDLFIVVSPGTIWLSRFLLVVPFALFRKRPNLHPAIPSPHHSTTYDPFCFSFFVTTENLSSEKLLLPEGDPYMAYWLASLIPVFDRDNVCKYLKKENCWLFEVLPNIQKDKITTIVAIQSRPFFLRGLEKFAKFFQTKFLPQTIKDLSNLDSRVMISDSMLKFHLNDRRAYFRDEWKKLYEARGVS